MEQEKTLAARLNEIAPKKEIIIRNVGEQRKGRVKRSLIDTCVKYGLLVQAKLHYRAKLIVRCDPRIKSYQDIMNEALEDWLDRYDARGDKIIIPKAIKDEELEKIVGQVKANSARTRKSQRDYELRKAKERKAK